MHRSAALLLLLCGVAQASPLFDHDSVLDLSLEGPLSATFGDKTERRERAFSLHVDGITVPVEIRTRGKFRADVCQFPPLRLNFSANNSNNGVFTGEDKLKLVTHCKRGSKYEKNVVSEYVIYRIMNILSDVSLRARLLRIRYVDTDKAGGKPVVRLAFVIESDDSIAERLGGEILHELHVISGMFDVDHEALVFVFQYMIANTDWSFVRVRGDDDCCHNGRLIKVDDRKYYLPYDFDMSGFVNASYAQPHPKLKLRNVRTRRYRGYCTDREVLRKALRFVVARREEILGVISDLPESTAKDIKSRTAFLNQFFRRAAAEDRLLDRFERRCLG